MPSILSRLRNRTLSQHSNASAQSATTPVSPPLAPQAESPALSPSRSEPVLVDRRIVEDLPALLGSLQATQSPPSALRPPRKRSGFASLGLRSTLKDAILVQDDPHAASEKENEELPPSALVAAPSAWKGKQRQSSTSSPWSTFGRHRRHPRSPYGSPQTPSGRSSRIPSADSGALRSSSVNNVGEGQTVSNIASTASIDHPTNSRPTESSRDVSVLSTLAGSISNRSSHSHKSTAVTFGFQSPPIHDVTLSPSQRESAEFVAYTSMPVLPLAYSTDSILSSRNTFPRRHKQRKPRSQPHELTDSNRFHQEGEQFHPWPPPSGSRPCLGAAGERPANAVPHAKRESATETTVRPCSPPLIPPPLSSSSSPTTPAHLDAENPSDGISSRSPPHIPNSRERADDSWMSQPRNASTTLSRRASDTRDPPRRGSSTASRTSTPSRTRSKRASQLSEQSTPIASTSSSSNQNGGAGPFSTAFPAITTPAPPSSLRVPRTPRTASEPGLRSVSEKSGYETPLNNKGKRKAEEVDITPPDQRVGHHATFVIPADGRRSHHVSEASKAPSSYNDRKRARLSTVSPSGSPSHSSTSRPTSLQRYPTDSWPSRTGPPTSLHRATSKTTSTRSPRPESMSAAPRQAQADRRRSMSEISFPISALVAPHAPSVSIRSGGYYMRDPRKPPRVQPTPWTLTFPSPDEQGSPVHAWAFFVGFVLFPLWWVASFWRIPRTRRVGGTDTEKAVTLDDPQVEHDARSWRSRCRIMSVISLFTYIPFIVLVAVFVPRA